MKKFLLFLLICSCSAKLNSQIPAEPHTALSPNAASLGVYGNNQVSLFSGRPDITIPLYEIDEEGIKIPITLNYDASGVRPDQRPGWVGLNWSLNAGGVITRQINDISDESNHPSGAEFTVEGGYYWQFGIANTSDWNRLTYLQNMAKTQKRILQDTEPDEFYFNFLNYSGKFCLDHNGEWIVMSEEPLKVTFDNVFLEPPFARTSRIPISSESHIISFGQFTITDGYGIKYIFGGDTSAIEYSKGFFSQSYTHWLATSWYLTKIKFPNNQEINFKYERGDYTNQMLIAANHFKNVGTAGSNNIFVNKPSCGPAKSWANHIGACITGKLLSPVFLREITSQYSKVIFSRSLSTQLDYARSVYDSPGSTEWYLPELVLACGGSTYYPDCLEALKTCQLDKISINQRSYSKSISFTYSNDSEQRLTLYELKESDKPAYRFVYKDMNLLPGYLSNRTDHWGFFNNIEGELHIDKWNIYHRFRRVNPEVLHYGIIDTIYYPTGGYTKYIFEPHTYSKELAETRWILENRKINFHAGGLRIKKIIDSPHIGSNQEYSREYGYNTTIGTEQNPSVIASALSSLQSYVLATDDNLYTSSGILGGKARYYFPDYTAKDISYSDLYYKGDFFSTVSLLPSCFNASSSHVGYTMVTEKFSDGSYIKHNFSNFDTGCMDEPADVILQVSRTPYEPYASKSQERGLLTLKEEYDSGGTLVKTTNMSYEKNRGNDHVRSMAMDLKYMCPANAGAIYYEGASYKIYMYSMRPKKTVTTYYNPTMTESTTLTYDERGQVDAVTTETPGAPTRVKSHLYPYRYGAISPYSEMTQMNMIKPVVEQIEYVGGVEAQRTKVDYKKMWLNPQQKYVYVPASVKQSTNGSGSLYVRRTYDRYNGQGRLIQSKDAIGIPTVYVWGYGGSYVVAKIENAGLGVVQGCRSLSYIDSTPLAGGLSKEAEYDLRKIKGALVTTYEFNSRSSFDVSKITDPTNRSTHFEYDSQGRLVVVHDGDGFPVESYEYHYINQ